VRVISGYRGGVHEICTLSGFYAMWIGRFVLTFQDNLSAALSVQEEFSKLIQGHRKRWMGFETAIS